MDKYHRDIVRKKAVEAAKMIEGKLPESPSHPSGRNPMAHIYQVIQTIIGCSIHECSNDRLDDVLSIIQDCVDLVDVYDVSLEIKHKYKPQERHPKVTLEQFFE